MAMADAAATLVENLEGTDVEVVKVRNPKNSKSMVKDQENVAKKALICRPDVKADVVMLDASSGETCGASRSDINVENMVVDGSSAQSLKQTPESAKMVKGLLKRKRVSIEGNLVAEDMESLGRQCRCELDDLFEYYKEFSAIQMNLEAEVSSNNHMIACLLEESNLSFSKLVEEIYVKLKGREGITLASVKTSILYVGQRMIYGISKNEADVLEDTSDSCLWCWEVIFTSKNLFFFVLFFQFCLLVYFYHLLEPLLLYISYRLEI